MAERPNNLAGRVAAGAAAVLAAGAAVYFVAGGRLGPRRDISPPDDLLRLRRTDANLVAYEEAGAVDTGLAEPRGLAVDGEGRIYVAGGGALRIFDPNGAKVREFPTGPGGTSLAVGTGGTIFLALKDRVESYDANGLRLGVWDGFDPNSMFSSIAAGEAGVYLADDNAAEVLLLDTSGKIVARLGRRDANRSILLRSPHFDVRVGPDGLLWLTNPGRLAVEAYTPEGEPKLSWGTASADIDGFSGCCNPKDIAFLPDGSVVTGEKGLPRVKVYDRAGEFLCVVAGAENFDPDVKYLDLAVDGRGRVLVLDPARKTVRIFVRRSPG